MPFCKVLREPILPKSVLILTGRATNNGQRFIVDFLIDLKKESDVAFHFNPRFGNYVALNSRLNGLWNEEIAVGTGAVPFGQGQEFTLEFFFTGDEFLVAVDREHFCRFGYRSSLRQINKVEVFGDILLFSIVFTSKCYYPPSALHENTNINGRLKVPYWRYFVKPVEPSTNIHIRGSIPKAGKSFIINMYTDWSAIDPDIGFHFRPCLSGNKEDFVVCNSKKEGKWGEEEPFGWGKIPFVAGHSFFMDIFVMEKHFVVSVNGSVLCRFEQRVHPSKIKYFAILKDIILRHVKISKEITALPLILDVTDSSLSFDSLDVPFHRDFVDPLVPKTDLLLCGTIKSDAIQFSLNLLDRRGDVALHFNPRFDQNYIARNHRIGGTWGTEESQSICKSPFQRGKPFSLEIFLTRSDYLVSVNGLHFCSFAYKIPIAEVKAIEIEGDVKLTKVELMTKDRYPSVLSPGLKLSEIKGEIGTPLLYQLKEPFTFGSEMIIRGRIKLLPWVFYINLQDSPYYWPHPQIGFHMSVRLTSSHPGIVLNSWKENGWGQEQKINLGEKFIPGGEFLIRVKLSNEGGSGVPNFTVWAGPPSKTSISRDSFPPFKTKVDSFAPLTTLYIQGDVFISNIQINNGR